MAENIAFRQIPATQRLPLFWAEVDPTLANSSFFPQRNLVIGQTITTGANAGSIHTTGTTNLLTASANAVLHFASTPAGVHPGMYVQDLTTAAAIAAGTTVLSVTGTTVTMSAVASAQVNSADSILFSDLSPQLVTSATQAKSLFGSGSMAADMVGALRRNDADGELWVVPLIDDPAATAATGTMTITGTPTVNATLPLYVAGVSVAVAVTTTMNATAIGTAVAAAINAAFDPYTSNPLPVTATAGGGVVTMTARHAGLAANDIDLRLAYFGIAAGEQVPAGLGVTFGTSGASLNTGAMTGGATNPSALLIVLLATLGDQSYDFIAFPYSDAGSLNAIKSFMDDSSGRWAWSRQIYGHAFAGSRGSVGTLQTLGNGRNDPHASIMGAYDSPTSPWQWAAALTGACAKSLRADPGLPLHTVTLAGVLAPPRRSRFQLSDRTTLNADGISTYTVQRDGSVLIEAAITTYQTNTFGQPDVSYLKVETMFLLMAVLRYLRTGVTTVMARKKLAADGTRVSPGSNIVTPKIIVAYMVQVYGEMLNLGWVQDQEDFTAGLVVQINAQNPNRVDVLWPGILVNQLDVFALLAQFRLQPPPAASIA